VYKRQVYIVHRLDRAARGILVLAHKRKTAGDLSRLFEKREVEKQYQAMVVGKFPENLKITDDIDGKKARTHASLIQYSERKNHSLLAVQIETGRKHQIRRHLASSGYPIVGDRLYGRAQKISKDEEDLCLTSCFLAFSCPETGRKKRFSLPDEFRLSL